ncbi:MAG: bifunctional riboflavin kinase/FMN adenylyltransferase [Planctomycetota bacterium]
MTDLIHLDDLATVAESVGPESQGAAVAIGNFDGVHVGHSAMLRRLADMCQSPPRRLDARQSKTRSGDLGELRRPPVVAVTFDPHPAAVLSPQHWFLGGDLSIPNRLTSMKTRAERMDGLGVDKLLVLRSDRGLLRESAEDFYRKLLVEGLGAKYLIEGPNFCFGRDRGGCVDQLRDWCPRDGMTFEVADAAQDGGAMISSSRIRDLIVAGQIDAAVAMMGWPHRIEADVIRGAQRGRELGFPTANLGPLDVVTPGDGVYGGTAKVNGRRVPAAIHIGPNPTFESSRATKIEAHLIDFDGQLYGTQLAIDIQFRVRDVVRFDSRDDLVEQLKTDISDIRHRLDGGHLGQTHER